MAARKVIKRQSDKIRSHVFAIERRVQDIRDCLSIIYNASKTVDFEKGGDDDKQIDKK